MRLHVCDSVALPTIRLSTSSVTQEPSFSSSMNTCAVQPRTGGFSRTSAPATVRLRLRQGCFLVDFWCFLHSGSFFFLAGTGSETGLVVMVTWSSAKALAGIAIATAATTPISRVLGMDMRRTSFARRGASLYGARSRVSRPAGAHA